jgi:hypothetical protein
MAEAHQSVGVLREEISNLVASLQQSNSRALEAETDNFNRVPALLRKMTWRKSPRRPSPIPPPSLLHEYGASNDLRSSPLTSTSPTGADATSASTTAPSDIELALRMREIQVDELQRRLAMMESEWQNERLSLEQHAATLKSDLEIKTGDLLSKLELACHELEDARQTESFLNSANYRQAAKIEEFEAENEELKALLDTSTRNEAEYSMQLVEAQGSIHTLRGQRDAITREMEALKQQNSALQTQLNQVMEASKYTMDTQTIIRQLQHTTEEMLVARADAKRMNTVVSDKSATISKLEEENAKLRSTASRLQFLSDATRATMYQREAGDAEETPSFERIRLQQRMVGRQTNTTPGAGMTPGGGFRARVVPRRGSITNGTPGTGLMEDKHRSRSTEPGRRQLARSKAPAMQYLIADDQEPQQSLSDWNAGMASSVKSLGGTIRMPRVTIARLGLAALLTRILNRTVQKQQCWYRWREEVLISRCQIEEINNKRTLQILEASQQKNQELHAALTDSVAALQSTQTTSAGMVKAAKQEIASLKSSYNALLNAVSPPASSTTPATILAQPPQPVQVTEPTIIRLVDRKSSVEPIGLPTPVARPSLTTNLPTPTLQSNNTALSSGKSQLAAALAAMDSSISQFRIGTPSKLQTSFGTDNSSYSVLQSSRLATPSMHTLRAELRGDTASDWPPHPDT